MSPRSTGAFNTDPALRLQTRLRTRPETTQPHSVAMKLFAWIRRRIAMELEASHTAIVFHWPDASGIDVTFVLRGIVDGEELHRRVDALLEEHAPATDGSQEVITEVTVFWHHPCGSWDMEEFLSHYYATEPPATA